MPTSERLHDELVARVRARMRARGMTQADLARRAGLTQKHLSQMLTGRVDGALAAWQRLLDATDDPTPPALFRAWGEALLGPWAEQDPDVQQAWRDLQASVERQRQRCRCGHPWEDHDEAGACMHLCDCAWSDPQHTSAANDPVHETDEG